MTMLSMREKTRIEPTLVRKMTKIVSLERIKRVLTTEKVQPRTKDDISVGGWLLPLCEPTCPQLKICSF